MRVRNKKLQFWKLRLCTFYNINNENKLELNSENGEECTCRSENNSSKLFSSV